jgi:hypothetical protein
MSQCPSCWVGPKRNGRVITFCTKRSGHEGYHRGTRKAWDAKGKAVTLKVADADSKKRGETWR